MKCFAIILLIATVISVTFAEETNQVEQPAKTFAAPAPEKSIKSLFLTLTKLVEGVLNNDKFVLAMLGLQPPLDLTDDQTNQLQQLLHALDKINEEFKPENQL